VLEVVEQVCNRVIVIAKGRILADARPADLTKLMSLPNLESVFAQLVQQQDTRALAQRWLRSCKLAIREEFQRLFMMSEPEGALSERAGALGAVRASAQPVLAARPSFSGALLQPRNRLARRRRQGSRLILIALATGLPGFMVALYLYPVYHPLHRLAARPSRF
jgi:ABC-type glutathione transport system ATPase component